METNNIHYTKSEQLEELEESLKNINNIIDDINLLDYKIGETNDSICRASGFDREQARELINNESHELFFKIREVNKKIHTISVSINKSRDKLIKTMESKAYSLKKSVKELEIIKTINPLKNKITGASE